MKKLDVGQTISILANLGVIAGIVFLGVELQQNNTLPNAQARVTRAQVRIDWNDLMLQSPELTRAWTKADNGELLTAVDERLLDQLAEGILVRWEYVYGEFQEGLLDEGDVPVELWRRSYSDTLRFAKFWQERGNYSFRPDFVQYMEENVVNER